MTYYQNQYSLSVPGDSLTRLPSSTVGAYGSYDLKVPGVSLTSLPSTPSGAPFVFGDADIASGSTLLPVAIAAVVGVGLLLMVLDESKRK
jgi:hypothetical protein